jgi:hypothetical protein
MAVTASSSSANDVGIEVFPAVEEQHGMTQTQFGDRR